MNMNMTCHCNFVRWGQRALLAAVLLWGTDRVQAQHGHLNAGAVSPDAGAQLLWVNGALFAAESGYVQTLAYSTSGRFADTYNAGPTVTALPNSLANNGPSPFAALGGSFINMELTLISAPTGAAFSFWESTGATPAYVLNVGAATGLIALSEEALGAGNPGADPYGHIHGRRFSVTTPGEYLVGFKLYDTCDYGPGATPLHTPSDTLIIKFVATVPEPSSGVLVGLGVLGSLWRRTRRNRARR